MEGRSLWIKEGDVDGRIEPGNVVKAARVLSDWCLRGDDGSDPVQPGSVLEIVDVRPWGAAQAVEVIGVNATDEAPAIMQAMLELEAEGLWEFTSETRPEIGPDGDIEMVTRDEAVIGGRAVWGPRD